MRKYEGLIFHRLRKRRGDTRELAAQLAPLEELHSEQSRPSSAGVDGSALATQENGTIIVGSEKSALAKNAADEGNQARSPDAVVFVIAGLILAFIVFIAWQVSQMPAITK
jgi:hypothetical protein